MDDSALVTLRQALASFIDAPTQQRQGALVEAAERYRDNWIELQASGSPSVVTSSEGTQPATRYKRLHFVTKLKEDGTEVTLALQSRTSVREGHTWPVVSWRTRLGPGGPNRRFYVTNGDPWSLDARVALHMLTQLEQLGGLDEQYFDLERRPEFIVTASDDVNSAQRSAMLQQITMVGEDWGHDPFFVVLNDPNEDWRKILIVNRETGRATFRSTTKNETYMPRKNLRPGSAWYLDNSMQDTNVQQARALLQQLKRIVTTLT